MTNDPQQGIGSQILGAGSDWNDPTPPTPLDVLASAEMRKIVEEWGKREAERRERLIMEVIARP